MEKWDPGVDVAHDADELGKCNDELRHEPKSSFPGDSPSWEKQLKNLGALRTISSSRSSVSGAAIGAHPLVFCGQKRECRHSLNESLIKSLTIDNASIDDVDGVMMPLDLSTCKR